MSKFILERPFSSVEDESIDLILSYRLVVATMVVPISVLALFTCYIPKKIKVFCKFLFNDAEISYSIINIRKNKTTIYIIVI